MHLEQADSNDWPVLAKFAKTAFASGYTMKMLKEVLARPGIDICALPPTPPNDSSNCQPLDVSQGKWVLLEFSLKVLQQYIVRFLVVEDLVSSTWLYCVSA